jgi:dihydroorotate dehydrogenase electron transfer subunit
MSVAGVYADSNHVEFIFKVVGRGTTLLSQLSRGDRLDILGPLGGTFALPRKNQRVVIVAGGTGLSPVMYLADRLVADGFDPGRIEFFYGGRSSGDLVQRSRIRKLGVNFHPATDDGSFGRQGLVTQFVEEYLRSGPREKMRLYACGPEPMLKVVDALGLNYGISGQLSLEAPMPCGFGVCLGCVVPLTKGGHARVCAEGPVFDIGEVIL